MFRDVTNMFLSHIKSIVRPLLRLHPTGEAFARHIRFQIWRLKVRMVSQSKRLDVNKTYWINPHNIQYALTEPHYNKYGDMGRIIGGSWDLKTINFTETDIYKAFYAHFIHTQSWESTPFYDRVLKEIQTGGIKWGCKTQSEFDTRLKTLDSLYKDINENGYKAQQELFEIQFPGLPSLQSIDEVAIRIGRNGDLLLQDGRHRLAIASLLNLAEIPVKITARHSDWYHLRNEILAYARANGNKVYQPLSHIDLREIPAAHGVTRFETIKSYLRGRRGNLLDLGAHWGYFCHECEEEGFNCFAIENDIRNLYVLKRLKRAENRRFQVIEESVLNYKSKTNFSVVLALNIFHHFLKQEETYYKLIDFLRNLNMELIFFEPHLSNERQMMGAYKNYGCEEFVDFVLRHSDLNHSKLIGKADDERPIYMLYK